MDHMIEISHLSKRFGTIQAVDDISFSVRQGELFAFLGVNGAGKSTTISILCGLLERDAGSVLVDGHDIDREMQSVKKAIGVVFQQSVLDGMLTVRENLESRAALYGITGKRFAERLSELATLLDFKDLLGRRLGKLSGGQRRRIDIARALLHHPRLLILDEPTTGLDPATRKLLWETITKLREDEGMTVLLTTHYMEEAADADYVVILDSGRIVAEGTPLQLKNHYAKDYITLYGVSESDVASLGYPFARVRDGFRVEVPHTGVATELIIQKPTLFVDYEIVKGKMDDIFLAVTGKHLVEEKTTEKKGGK